MRARTITQYITAFTLTNAGRLIYLFEQKYDTFCEAEQKVAFVDDRGFIDLEKRGLLEEEAMRARLVVALPH